MAKRVRPPGYAAARESRRLLRVYGITQEQYDEMATRQRGLCAICGHAPTKTALCVDHDHATGRVRGLLCAACNRALGGLGDNAEGLRRALRRALDYLESA